jgi:predicted Zn finger-like uncharacterized protein
MRLTCPKCGAEYEVAAGMVPLAGRHVQCTVCHTRWFVRGAAAEAVSEEQILRRLEARRPSAEGAAEPAGAGAKVIALSRGTPLRSGAAPPPEATGPTPAEPVRRDGGGKPEPAPGVGRPAAVASAAAPARTAPRLDLETLRETPEMPPPAQSRFARGLLLVLVPFLLAIGAYRFADPIASSVPAAAPTLDAYQAVVDDLRAEIERQIAGFRKPPEPG